jgi:hypothetical protein
MIAEDVATKMASAGLGWHYDAIYRLISPTIDLVRVACFERRANPSNIMNKKIRGYARRSKGKAQR